MKKVLLVQTNYPEFLRRFHEKLDTKKLNYKDFKRLWDEEWFGQGNFYSKHLSKHGWEAKEVIINDWIMQSTWAKENKIDVKQGLDRWLGPLPELIKNTLGIRGWVKQIMFEQIKSFRPDIVYMHDLTVLSVDDIRRLKRAGVKVAGQIACPLPLNQSPLREYDLIVTSFPHYVEMFRSWGINSQYLPWCFEREVVKKIVKRKKRYDVVFVGGYSGAHSEGNKMLERLARKVKVDFWGYGANMLTDGSEIKKNFHDFIWGKEMYQVFADAKIVVNRHINVAEDYANNMRMYEATGVGTMLLTDDKKNITEFFEPDKEIVVYKNASDLINKAEHYLKYSVLREKIARAGQRKTLKMYTYDKRMKELARIFRKLL